MIDLIHESKSQRSTEYGKGRGARLTLHCSLYQAHIVKGTTTRGQHTNTLNQSHLRLATECQTPERTNHLYRLYIRRLKNYINNNIKQKSKISYARHPCPRTYSYSNPLFTSLSPSHFFFSPFLVPLIQVPFLHIHLHPIF